MHRRRAVAAALALVAVALALPTVAAPLSPTDAGVTVTTANSTNTEYVRTTDDGNVTLVVDGLNPEARTYVADVFRVRYDGDTSAAVWISNDADGLTFLVDGEEADAPTDNVTLGPGGSVPVGVVVDTTAGSSGSGVFTVRARVTDPDTGTGTAPPDPASGGVAPDADDPATARVTSPAPTSRTVTLRDTAAGRSTTLDMGRLVVARAGDGVVTLDELSVVGDGGNLDLDVRVTPPDSAGALPASATARPLGAVRIEERQGAAERATLRFVVDRAYLDAVGHAAADLRVYRYDGRGWSERGVDVVAREDGRAVLETETSGFSTFVVAAPAPDLRVTAAALRTASVAPGDPVTVTAEVTNAGATAGARTITATVGGDPVAERRIELAAGASTTVTFRVEPPATGTYTVRVGPTEAGRLVVDETGAETTSDPGTASPSPPATATPADRTGTPAVEPAGGAPTETLWLVAVLLGVVATLALVRRLRGSSRP
jgi:hypothetical protein